MQTSTIVNPVGQWLITNSPEKYEEFILAACLTSDELWSKLSRVLCQVVKKSGSYEVTNYVNDFSTPEKYALFRAILKFRETPGTTVNIPKAGIEAALSSLTAEDGTVTAGVDTKDVLDLFTSIKKEYTKEAVEAIVNDTWQTWATNIRIQQQLLYLKRSGAAANVVEKLDNINTIVSGIKDLAKTEKTTFSINDVLVQEEVIVDRIPLSRTFKGLNECLGGGFGKTEHAIFLVPTGRGKTVISCQIAAEVAAAGRHVLLITTEQHPRELVPRMVSCMSYSLAKGPMGRISFDKIKDGITPELYEMFTNDQKEVLNTFAKATNPYLHIENWVCSNNEVADIKKILDNVNATLPNDEKVEMVILDWIGGAITKGIVDSNVKRNTLKNAAIQMHEIAYKYNVACISTAQADKAALGKKRVTGENFADCKSLHDEAEVAFGLSAIRTTETDDATGEKTSSYKNEQRLFCFKSRKAEGMDIPVLCNFKYQRFDKM